MNNISKTSIIWKPMPQKIKICIAGRLNKCKCHTEVQTLLKMPNLNRSKYVTFSFWQSCFFHVPITCFKQNIFLFLESYRYSLISRQFLIHYLGAAFYHENSHNEWKAALNQHNRSERPTKNVFLWITAAKLFKDLHFIFRSDVIITKII